MITPQSKIKALDDLVVAFNRFSKHDDIVFTNGCFDILHYGHLKYLYAAKKLGKILVVAVNSDDSVKRLKGKSRPINSLDVRMFQLACLEFVDYVTHFSEDTPISVITKLYPGILVKGGDYMIEEIVGHNVVANTQSIPLVNGFSTSDLIRKIKASPCD